MTISIIGAIAALTLAAVTSTLLIWLAKPLLIRYAMARPNARSSHRTPTPQGAGLAVISATMAAAAVILSIYGLAFPTPLLTALVLMASVGLADDLRPIPVLPRLLLQGFAVAIVVFSMPETVRLFQIIPLMLERCLVLLAGLWFVNLVNFMDGLDWITVAEVVPVTAALVLYGLLEKISPLTAIICASLCGAMLGFAPFNRPPAKVFLGDVGSLPIGLLLGWCLLELAQHRFAAAMLLPMYYIADATVTLLRRLINGERVWVAHRSHFYQRATDNGFTVGAVVKELFVLNVGLAALATASLVAHSAVLDFLLVLFGGIVVALQLRRFSRSRKNLCT